MAAASQRREAGRVSQLDPVLIATLRDRHQHDAAALRRLRPFGDAVDACRQRRGEADRHAAVARHRFQPLQRVVDLGRARHRVDHHIGLGIGQPVGAGDLAGLAARRGAVIDIDQAAPRHLAQNRRQRRVGSGEARAHEIGNADIALHAAEQPVQAIDILIAPRARKAASAGRDRCRDNRAAPSEPAAGSRGPCRAPSRPDCRGRCHRA